MILLGDEGDGAVDSSRRPCLHFEPIPSVRSEVAHITKCDKTVTIGASDATTVVQPLKEAHAGFPGSGWLQDPLPRQRCSECVLARPTRICVAPAIAGVAVCSLAPNGGAMTHPESDRHPGAGQRHDIDSGGGITTSAWARAEIVLRWLEERGTARSGC